MLYCEYCECRSRYRNGESSEQMNTKQGQYNELEGLCSKVQDQYNRQTVVQYPMCKAVFFKLCQLYRFTVFNITYSCDLSN